MNKNRRRRRKRIKKYSILKLIRFIFLLIALFFLIFLISKNLFNKKNNINNSYYYTSYYDLAYSKQNSSLNFKKISKIDDKYNPLDIKKWSILNINTTSYENVLIERLNQYFISKKINFDDLNLYIKKDNKILISINEKKQLKNYNIENFLNAVSFLDLYKKNNFNLEDNIRLIESDFNQGSRYYSREYIGKSINIKDLLYDMYDNYDMVSKNALNRYLTKYNTSIDTNLINLIKKTDMATYNVEDVQKIMQLYVEKINTPLIKLIALNEELYLNSIYTNVDNININFNNEDVVYDFGYVNSTTPYYYSIYSEKLSKKNIQDIGDIINRTIEEISTKRKLQY